MNNYYNLLMARRINMIEQNLMRNILESLILVLTLLKERKKEN